MTNKEAINYLILPTCTSTFPSAEYQKSMEAYQMAIIALQRLPEQQKGKWLEPSVSSEGIEEWQSCKCSVCGRYTTRPYLYYFDYPRFCSECGNPMEARKE